MRMHAILLLLVVSSIGAHARSAEAPSVEPLRAAAAEPLLLEQAMSLALRENPGLQAYSWELRIRDAEALQAGLFPNPELDIEVENFAGSGGYSGFDSSETTIALGQRIELGGKRPKRRQVADLEREMAGWGYRKARLAVLAEVSRTFTDVLSAQERLALAESILQLTEDSLAAVSRRVRAGASSDVERTRAQVEVSSARIEERRARAALEQARTRLAALWGENNSELPRDVRGDLFRVEAPRPIEVLLPGISSNPDIASWGQEIELREAVIALEDSKRIPDLTATGGVRRLEETQDSALVFGLSIPLGLADRNQKGRRCCDAVHPGWCALRRSSRSLTRFSLRVSMRSQRCARPFSPKRSERIGEYKKATRAGCIASSMCSPRSAPSSSSNTN